MKSLINLICGTVTQTSPVGPLGHRINEQSDEPQTQKGSVVVKQGGAVQMLNPESYSPAVASLPKVPDSAGASFRLLCATET